MNKFHSLLSFLEEYATFFEGILETEKEKLQILVHGSLKDIERSISIQQVNEKKIQNIEKKRAELQKSLGFENNTLQHIIDVFEGEEKIKLTSLFQRIDSALSEIKFYNKKGMEVASTNLHLFGEHQNNKGLYSKESLAKK